MTTPNLPNCFRCGCQPCECESMKETLKGLILGELGEHGRMNDEQLGDALDVMYERAGMRYDSRAYSEAIESLVSGRHIAREAGHWEGEFFYTICKPANRLSQEVLF